MSSTSDAGSWTVVATVDVARDPGRLDHDVADAVVEDRDEAPVEGVGEDQRARRRTPTPSTIANVLITQPQLAAEQRLSRRRAASAGGGRREVVGRRASSARHAARARARGVGLAHLVDDPAVGEEHDPVGVRGGDRVVGDHHDRLAELVDRAAQERRAPRRRTASRGCRSARRRRRSSAGWRAHGRRRRAAAGRRTARSAGASAGRAARPCRSRVSNHSWSGLRPASSSGSVMFSSAVSVGTRLNDWNTKPIRSRRSRVSCLVAERARARCRRSTPGPRSAVSSAGEAVHQRRLARAGRPHDRGELPGVEVDVDPVERPHLGRRPCRRSSPGRSPGPLRPHCSWHDASPSYRMAGIGDHPEVTRNPVVEQRARSPRWSSSERQRAMSSHATRLREVRGGTGQQQGEVRRLVAVCSRRGACGG